MEQGDKTLTDRAAAQKGRHFWNRFAERYAARPIKDIAAYEAFLTDVAARLKPDDIVLEIGCGTGGTAIRLAPGVASYTAADFSENMITIAKGKPAPAHLNFIVADAENSFAGGPFDAVCAFNVLHLVDDLPGTLSLIHSHLKPGGLLISKTWCFAGMGLKLRMVFAALRLFRLFPPAKSLTIPELRQTIQNTGFEINDEKVFGVYDQNPYIVARKLA